MAEPDPDTQHTIRIQYTPPRPQRTISICLINGQPHQSDNGQEWKPCTKEIYEAIALECIGYPPV